LETINERPENVKMLLSRLTRKKWLKRLERGKYLIVPLEAGPEREFTEYELLIASRLISPYYIGYKTALNFYGYTEQISSIVYVVSTRRKTPTPIHRVCYQFVTLKKEKFFGVKKVVLAGTNITISTPEKTICDCLDQPRYAGGINEVAKALRYGERDIDFRKVVAYGKRMNNRAILQRLGLLLERLGLGRERLLSDIRSSIGQGYVKLDPVGKSFGPYNSRWRVRVNVSLSSLGE
jgi:predicted transcriptional regulator of viral defense system